VLKYQWSGGYLRAWRSDRGELMVKMTEEQKAKRMAARRRAEAEAEAEEARELRRESRG